MNFPSSEDPGSVSSAVVGGGGREVVALTGTELDVLVASDVVVAGVVETVVSAGTDDAMVTVLEAANVAAEVGEAEVLGSMVTAVVTVVSGAGGAGSSPQPARIRATSAARPDPMNRSTSSRWVAVNEGMACGRSLPDGPLQNRIV